MKEGYQDVVMGCITQSEPGTIFFISDFAYLNNDTMVGKALSLAEKIGKLIRISKGIYFKPVYSEFGVVFPSTEKIVEAISKRDKAKIMPTGNMALNILGLSTQIPMNPVFLTTGSSRVIQIGKRKITLKHSAPRNFAFKGKIIPLIIQALKNIGRLNVTVEHVQKIRSILLKNIEEQTMQHDIELAPLWIKKILLPLAFPVKQNLNNHE